MPSTINGIGTWYYGRKNIFRRQGVCEQCGREAMLTSYDTKKWFTILYVPIIPLGTIHVFDECPACTKHRVMSLKEYEQKRDQARTEAQQQYEQQPRNPEAATELISVYLGFHLRDELEELAPELMERFPENTDVLNTLGYSLYYLGRDEEAAEVLQQSLTVKEDFNIRELLFFVYIRLRDSDQAACQIRDVLDKRIAEKAPLLLVLAEEYLYSDRTDDALDMLEQAVSIKPDLADKKDYKKLLKKTQKLQQTGKPLKRQKLSTDKTQINRPYNAYAVWGIAAAVLLVIVSIFVYLALQEARNPKVFLVNGLSRDYPVSVNGHKYVLRSLRSLPITLPEGTVQIQVLDESLPITERTIEMHSSFRDRIFSKPVFVINPDTVAPVFWSKIYYGVNPADTPEGENQLYIGETLYRFSDIDFLFHPFPDEVTLYNDKSEARTRLSLLYDNDIPQSRLAAFVDLYYNPQTTDEILRTCLNLDPDGSFSLYELAGRLSQAELIELLKPGLDSRPVRIDWHRMYQQTCESCKPDYDLVGEYKQRLSQNPDEPALHYLLGRIQPNPDEAIRHYKQSVGGPKPCAYGYNALSFYYAGIGEFQQALEYSDQAVKTDPDNTLFVQMQMNMMTAAGEYDRALACCQKEPRGIFDAGWMHCEAELWIRKQQSVRAQNAVDTWLAGFEGQYSPELLNDMRRSFDLLLAYLNGDLDRYAEMANEQDPDEQLVVCFHQKRSMLSVHQQAVIEDNAPVCLVLAILEDQLGHPEQSERLIQRAAEYLKKEGPETRRVARCLLGEEPINPDVLTRLAIQPDAKSIYLTALGWKYPEHREAFYPLADKLNYKIHFPHYFLKQIHREAEILSP